MKKTCPKCGADGNGKLAPKDSRYWCSSSAWEDGDFYQSPECVKRERDNLLERVKRLESILRRAEFAISFANLEPGVTRMLGDDYTEVLQLIRSELKEAKP